MNARGLIQLLIGMVTGVFLFLLIGMEGVLQLAPFGLGIWVMLWFARRQRRGR